MSDFMRAYIDGACSGNPGPGGYGIVMLDRYFGILHISGGKEETTNNEMELTALMRVLDLCSHRVLEVCTDSMYVINCFNHHAEWLTRENLPNRKIVERVHELLVNRDPKKPVKIVKVKGHSHDYWNDEADKLAKSWIKKDKK